MTNANSSQSQRRTNQMVFANKDGCVFDWDWVRKIQSLHAPAVPPPASCSRLLHRFAFGARLGGRAAAAPGIRGGESADRGLEEAVGTGLAEFEPDGALALPRHLDRDDAGLDEADRVGHPQADPDRLVLGRALVEEDEGPAPAQVDDHGVLARNPASPRHQPSQTCDSTTS